jgi:hypothetical protein
VPLTSHSVDRERELSAVRVWTVNLGFMRGMCAGRGKLGGGSFMLCQVAPGCRPVVEIEGYIRAGFVQV